GRPWRLFLAEVAVVIVLVLAVAVAVAVVVVVALVWWSTSLLRRRRQRRRCVGTAAVAQRLYRLGTAAAGVTAFESYPGRRVHAWDRSSSRSSRSSSSIPAVVRDCAGSA
ncbi:unnamed protein product, partial [Laminaria digitata]